MERKTASKFLDFEFKTVSVTKDGSGGVFIEGYANTKTKDRVGDVVLPKAFAKSLPTYQKNPVLLFQHNWDLIVGSVPISKIDEHGLWIKARISDAKDCDDVRTKVREGTLRTFSIGYNEIESDFDEASKTKIVKELELLEISIVTIPANTEASFRPVEQADGDEGGTDETKGLTVVLSDGVAHLIKDKEALPAVAALLHHMSKGDPIMGNQATPAQKAAGSEPAKPAEQNPAAAPAAEPADDTNEMCQQVKAVHGMCKEMSTKMGQMHEEIKALREEVKSLKSAPVSTDDGQKSIDEMSEEEAQAALAAESAELARMTAEAN